jgi:hypothetical protein
MNAESKSTAPPAPQTHLEYWRLIGDELRLISDATDRVRVLLQDWLVTQPIEEWNRRPGERRAS